MTKLSEKHCVACTGSTPPLSPEEALENLSQLRSWAVIDGHHLAKEYRFENFREALGWVNRIGEIAESEGHHPDLSLGWGYVRVEIHTHAINALSESDFILAAKIDRAELTGEGTTHRP